MLLMRPLRVGLAFVVLAFAGGFVPLAIPGTAGALTPALRSFSYFEQHPCSIATPGEVAKASTLPVSKSSMASSGGSSLEGPACDYDGPPDNIVSSFFGHENASFYSILYSKTTPEPSLGSGAFCTVNKGSTLTAGTFADVVMKGGSGWSLHVQVQAAHLPSCSLPVAVTKLLLSHM